MAAILEVGPANVSAKRPGKPAQFRTCCTARVVTLIVVNLRPYPALPPLAALAAGCLLAAPVQASLGLEAVTQATALATQAARALAPAGARVVALPGALDSRVQLAPCAQVQAFLPAGTPAWGRSRVGLRCTQGAVAWQVYLPVTVQVWAPAVVSTVALPAGARLEPGQLAIAEVDWAAAPSAPQARAEDLAERVLVRPVAAGQALRGADLKARQWFAAGDVVKLVALGPGFAVTGEGQAMAAGIEGQTVRVRTDSGRVVVGLAAGPRRVELSP